MQTVAYSYIRFSREHQADGDSLRRQLTDTRKYCLTHGLDLDESLELHDLGVSAFLGRNADKGSLGRFIAACISGRVAPGSALVVESLDRISRQSPRKAVRLLTELLDDHQIEIHLTQVGKVFRPGDEESEGIDLILAVAMAMRANEESKTKSKRIAAAWANKRENARDAGTIMTPSCPWWLERNPDDKTKFRIIEERAKVVREIYELASAGWGGRRIALYLNGKIAPPREGSLWRESIIRNWLVSRSAEGNLRATWKTRKKTGDYEIADYYPRVVDEKLAAKAHAGRINTAGRPPKKPQLLNIWRNIHLRAHDVTTGPEGQWMRWQGTRNGIRDEEGKRAFHYYLSSMSDDDGHAILNVSTRVLERLVSIAVSSAGSVEGLIVPPPSQVAMSAAVELTALELKSLETKLENLMRLVEDSPNLPKTILKRITETEGAVDDARARHDSAKSANNHARVRPSQQDISDILLAGNSQIIDREHLAGVLYRLIERIDLARKVEDLAEVGQLGDGVEGLWPFGGLESRKVVALIQFRAGARFLATNKPGEIAQKLSAR